MAWLKSLIHSAGPKLANCFQGQWYEVQFLVESFKRDFQAQNIIEGRKSKLLEKKDVSKKSKIPGWTNGIQLQKPELQTYHYPKVVQREAAKHWQLILHCALNYLRFGEIGDFCSDSHKAADTKGLVSTQ